MDLFPEPLSSDYCQTPVVEGACNQEQVYDVIAGTYLMPPMSSSRPQILRRHAVVRPACCAFERPDLMHASVLYTCSV